MSSLNRLKSIISKMKKIDAFTEKVNSVGCSDLFSYATSKNPTAELRGELSSKRLPMWDKLQRQDFDHTNLITPMNGFEEDIILTEEGKLWKYPIDNEQGMEAEQTVPFEDHVFFEHRLEEFPKNDSIQDFMKLVFAGLAKNPWVTVERKNRIIDSYRDYFIDKRSTYEAAGYKI